MTDLSTNEVHSRTLTAFFDTQGAAQTAVDDIVAAGIPREHVQITEGAAAGNAVDVAKTRDDKGFWDELKNMFLPDEDRYGYAEGLRRGGYLLSVRSDEANYTRIMDILDRDGAIDMDEREANWRASGWTGYQAGVMDEGDAGRAPLTDRAGMGGATTGVTGLAAAAPASPTVATPAPLAARPARAPAAAETLREGTDEVIPIYEERATVGKRDVNHGRVRLRSYVVETPFSQQVSLRNEQVQVERRPVDRPVGSADVAFRDRVIEAEEHAEEVVLSKEARVKEEISLRKTADTQSQTVQDTLRRTEFEVDDTRTGRGLAPATGTARVLGGVDAGRISEHMPVLASDGTEIGTVDHMEGADRIKLTKNSSPDGQHHFIPLAWVERVDTHVHLNRAAADVRANW